MRAALCGLALLLGSGCSAYDPDLLRFTSTPDAAPVGTAGTTVLTDARVPNDTTKPDAGPAFDAGKHVDAKVPIDTGIDEVDDAGMEETDAGCRSAANPSGGDCCPEDPDKTDRGSCGCGIPDVDTDGDHTFDCMDACTNDATKIAAGMCGCGVPDVDTTDAASCSGLTSALVHRYRFDGTGTIADDSVGTADGTLVNASLADTGTLVLAGTTTDQYVDLPNGIVSTLTNATFEAWLVWNGGNAWQRIFDFGDPSSGGENAQASGRTYLFLTTVSDTGEGSTVRATYKRTTSNEVIVNASGPLATGVLKQVVVVVDDANDQLALYIDGALAMSTGFTYALSSINDINNWIGRSQFQVDPEFAGTVHEFRIYNAALSAAQIKTSFIAGPDPLFLEP